MFWYNISPEDGINPRSEPYKEVFRYKWRYPTEGMKTGLLEKQTMKPCPFTCTSRWKDGTVTNMNSRRNIEVDGMARQVRDIRKRRKDSH